MRAMVLHAARQALELEETPTPAPDTHQVLLKVAACAVCRTDLHVVDGELPNPKLPLIPGHEIAGTIMGVGSKVRGLATGDYVGVPWLGWTCGECEYCKSGKENLCDRAKFTGYTLDGGYAEYAVADAKFCFKLPGQYSAEHAAPLLCAGLISYRSLLKAGDAEKLGLYGFGAAAHIVAQVAKWQGRNVYAFTRPGDLQAQDFARSLGAIWAGGSDERPPDPLDAAIIFAPIGDLVIAALRSVRKAGKVVCGGIHMSRIPAFDYELLWQERSICSVANLTRRDGEEFLALAPQVPVKTATEPFPLSEANEALDRLRHGRLSGAAVLTP